MTPPQIDVTTAEGQRAVRRALRMRFLSAAVLIPPVVLAVILGGRLFSALVAFAAILMIFEWTRMVEGKSYSWRFYVLAVATFISMMFAGAENYYAAYAVACVSGAITLIPYKGFNFWPAVAIPYIIAPCASLLWLRFDPDYGRALTILIFATVWAADSGAFLFGKLIGGPKISYALSPSKTWAGIGGGVVGGAVLGAIAGALLFGPSAMGPFFLAGGLLGVASVGGDLTESAFKRRFGVKDISQLIPGHGGVLDRLDGMIFATMTMTSVYLLYKVFEKL